jgi:hypothetical protein
MRNFKIEKLQAGETFQTSEKGNSMVPLIFSGQEHTLAPATLEEVNVGDIVYCKVHGKMFTHLVKARKEDGSIQIGNNHGHINGWTRQVYGKVIAVGGVPFKGAKKPAVLATQENQDKKETV